MLSAQERSDIEYEAMSNYISEVISRNKYSDEVLDGDIPEWRDADDYYLVPGKCILSAEDIKAWISDTFMYIADEYLKEFKGASSFSDIASKEELNDAQAYYDLVYSICYDIDDYALESYLFDEFCNIYFENNAEKD